MEAVILIGLQAAGKSSFYRARFSGTHIRISLDTAKTRRRETDLLLECVRAGRSFVIDNTNPTRETRARYIQPARQAGFRVVGYFFLPEIEGSLRRNAARTPAERVPVAGLFRTRKQLEPPRLDEGFDALFTVEVSAAEGAFERE